LNQANKQKKELKEVMFLRKRLEKNLEVRSKQIIEITKQVEKRKKQLIKVKKILVYFKQKLNEKQLENRRLNKLKKKMELQIFIVMQCTKMKQKTQQEEIRFLKKNQSKIKRSVSFKSKESTKNHERVEVKFKVINEKQIPTLEARFKKLLMEKIISQRLKLKKKFIHVKNKYKRKEEKFNQVIEQLKKFSETQKRKLLKKFFKKMREISKRFKLKENKFLQNHKIEFKKTIALKKRLFAIEVENRNLKRKFTSWEKMTLLKQNSFKKNENKLKEKVLLTETSISPSKLLKKTLVLCK